MHPASPIGWLLWAVMALTLTAPAAMGDTVAPATDCAVMASGQMASRDYIASYTGGCKNGRADGEGEARWTLRYAPEAAPVVWQGRFVDGIYLAEPDVLGAHHLARTNVLLDLGPLTLTPLNPDGSNPPPITGHLWVESRADGKLPALACHPLNLHVSTQGPLHEDDVARQWLDVAYQRWQRACHASMPPVGPARSLRVQLHEGRDWTPDAWGNLPAGVVQAYTALGTATPPATANWRGYRNRAAQEHARALHQLIQETDRRLNEMRLRNLARIVGAKRYVTLDVLGQNPFRFGEDVLLVDVRLVAARTPTEALVRGTTGRGSGGGILQGDIAQWDDASRIAAVRVIGRSIEPDSKGLPLLQLLTHRVCDTPDCTDFLVMSDGRRYKEIALEE